MSICCKCCVLSVEVPASGSSLVQRSPTECGVSECHREASTMRRPWPTRGCCAMKKEYVRVDYECMNWIRVTKNRVQY
jgi:hypothetical protein